MKAAILAVLSITAAILLYLLVTSIMEPINFQHDKEVRYNATIARLKDIRTAQVAYRSEHHRYTSSFDTLISFLKNDSFRVVRQIGSLDDSAAVAEGRVFRDTISVCVRDSLFKRGGFIIDSLCFVPYAHGAKFEMAAGELQTGSKVIVQVFEASVLNKVLLNGLDHQEIVNLDDVAKQLNRFPGLKVGSLTEATNNAGNWE